MQFFPFIQNSPSINFKYVILLTVMCAHCCISILSIVLEEIKNATNWNLHLVIDCILYSHAKDPPLRWSHKFSHLLIMHLYTIVWISTHGIQSRHANFKFLISDLQC